MTDCSNRALLRVLDDRGPAATTELAGELGAHPLTVDHKCSELRAEGHVRQISVGVYSITDDGREYLVPLAETSS